MVGSVRRSQSDPSGARRSVASLFNFQPRPSVSRYSSQRAVGELAVEPEVPRISMSEAARLLGRSCGLSDGNCDIPIPPVPRRTVRPVGPPDSKRTVGIAEVDVELYDPRGDSRQSNVKQSQRFTNIKSNNTSKEMDAEQQGWQEELLRPQLTSETLEFQVEENWSCLRLATAQLLNTTSFKLLMTFVVIANIAVVVIETDMRADLQTDEKIPDYIVLGQYMFLSLYSAEIAARVYVVRAKWVNSAMNVFDAVIVVLDITSEVLNRAVGDLPSISFLRVLRVLRIVRVIRQFLVFRELYLMMQGLVSALRAIIFATLMVAVVLTMWSIIAVELLHEYNVKLWEQGVYGDCLRCKDAFSSVWAANCTFIKTIIAGDSWGELALPMMTSYPWTSVIILSALLTVQLGLLNLIVAIIVDRASQARQEDEELLHTVKQEEFANSFTRLLRLFNSMDEDRSGILTQEELLQAYESHPEFAAMMQLMDVKQEDMALVFEVMDRDRSGGVDYKEFVEQLHTLRTYDPHTLLIFIRHNCELIRQKLEDDQRQLQQKLWDQGDQLAEVVKMLDGHNRCPPPSWVKATSSESTGPSPAAVAMDSALAQELERGVEQLRLSISECLARATQDVANAEKPRLAPCPTSAATHAKSKRLVARSRRSPACASTAPAPLPPLPDEDDPFWTNSELAQGLAKDEDALAWVEPDALQHGSPLTPVPSQSGSLPE